MPIPRLWGESRLEGPRHLLSHQEVLHFHHQALGDEDSLGGVTFEIVNARIAIRGMALHLDAMRTGNGVVGSVALIRETSACLSEEDDHGPLREITGMRGSLLQESWTCPDCGEIPGMVPPGQHQLRQIRRLRV
jgi:hypothetical protein